MGGVWLDIWHSQDTPSFVAFFHFHFGFERTSDVMPFLFQVRPSDRSELEVTEATGACDVYRSLGQVTTSQMNQDTDGVSFTGFDFNF